ncbi:MAG: polyhydroxyalkanoic acid system family protein [Pirellulaceae bacterium]|nr:polyhydroxyalkanoic acid system family protein [Pirellulaceae bacterium]
MAEIRLAVEHDLGREQARLRVERFIDEVRREYGDRISDVRGQWSADLLEFSFIASGLTIRGALTVEEQHVRIIGPLPLAASFFRGMIEQTMRQELEKLLR